MTYRFTPIVEKLPSAVPFVGPEAQERQRGAEFRARIGANESVFGASAKAVHAMQREAVHAWKYGDPENHDLKEALAAHHGVAPRNIVVGEGIDGLFGYTARLFIAPGVPVATSLGAYPTFNYQVATCGGRLVTVPYRDDREDPEALLALTREHDTALVYLSNPDNPMGSWWDAATVQRMIENVPDTALLCLDEAYCDFAPAGTLPEIDVEDTRVLRFRTFSKAHGLAGCRIGYAIGEAQLIQSFDKLRNHFGVNRIAQAGALAALTDRGHLREVVHKVTRARARIGAIAQDNQLQALPSAANFVAIDCGREGDYAGRVLTELNTRGVFVRMPGVAPLNRCIRVSAGTDDDLQVFANALPAALHAAAS